MLLHFRLQYMHKSSLSLSLPKPLYLDRDVISKLINHRFTSVKCCFYGGSEGELAVGRESARFNSPSLLRVVSDCSIAAESPRPGCAKDAHLSPLLWIRKCFISSGL